MAIAPRRCPPKQCHYPLWTMPFSSQTMRINLRPNNALGQCVRPGKQGPTLAGGNLGEGLAPANLNGQHLNYPQLTSAASPQPYTPTQTLLSAFSSSTNHNQGNHFRISIFWRDKSKSFPPVAIVVVAPLSCDKLWSPSFRLHHKCHLLLLTLRKSSITQPAD